MDEELKERGRLAASFMLGALEMAQHVDGEKLFDLDLEDTLDINTKPSCQSILDGHAVNVDHYRNVILDAKRLGFSEVSQ